MKYAWAWMVYLVAGLVGSILTGYIVEMAFFMPGLIDSIVVGSCAVFMLIATIGNFSIAFAFSKGRLCSVTGTKEIANLTRDGVVIKRGAKLRWIRYFDGEQGKPHDMGRLVFFLSAGRPWSCGKADFLVCE